ncbi:hypothetical protein GCM10010400_22660 [Streptomyces aculeolatus]
MWDGGLPAPVDGLRAVARFRAGGHDIEDEDAARISPLRCAPSETRTPPVTLEHEY